MAHITGKIYTIKNPKSGMSSLFLLSLSSAKEREDMSAVHV